MRRSIPKDITGDKVFNQIGRFIRATEQEITAQWKDILDILTEEAG